jgi:hypothetical protein
MIVRRDLLHPVKSAEPVKSAVQLEPFFSHHWQYIVLKMRDHSNKFRFDMKMLDRKVNGAMKIVSRILSLNSYSRCSHVISYLKIRRLCFSNSLSWFSTEEDNDLIIRRPYGEE